MIKIKTAGESDSLTASARKENTCEQVKWNNDDTTAYPVLF